MIATFLVVETKFKPDALLPEGHEFEPDDIPVLTEWGDVLPPVKFSLDRLEDTIELASSESESPASAVAKAMVKRTTTFNELNGCWELPLRCEYDEKNRARYPSLSVPQLGIKNRLAHRLTIEFLREVELPPGKEDLMVDHRCMSHACCNPYHLEAITPGTNNDRGRRARRRARMPDLFALTPATHQDITYGEIKERQILGGSGICD